ncbi:MAG TPA: AsmA family protein, partial [Albitalea sp.]|nr:AsmA family protein [Albitalea sp.]
MPVWLRRSLFALLGLLVVLIAAATWLVMTFDANRYKGVAIDWMKTHRDRTLVIAGPIELSVFPRLGVKLSGIRLSEVGKPDEFAALDEAALAADVLPLLHGELVIGRVQAKGVRAVYLRDAKGKSNIDDLMQPAPSEPQAAAAGKPVRFDVSGIELADVRARVKDDMAGVNGELLLKSLATGRITNKVESKVS